MSLGQILTIISLLGLADSILAMIFPGVYVRMCKALGMIWWKNEARILKTAYWEFFISLVIFLIGINI